MKVAFDVSPLCSNHRVRGIGFYTQRLKDNLNLLALKEKNFTLIEFEAKLKEKADIVHYPYFQPFFITLPLVKRFKTVVTIHDFIPLKFPKRFPPGVMGEIKWKLQRFLLNKVEAVITDSLISKKDIVEFSGILSGKIFVIYLAAGKDFKLIRNKDYLSKLKKRFKLPEKFVLYVGDLNWNKNVLALARACVNLGYPLVVVGKQAVAVDFDLGHVENRQLTGFQKIAEKNARKIIRLGFVPTKDLAGIYNLATCYAQISYAEGFGLPVLEAMASGCPALVSKGTSLEEIAGKAALLVSPKDKAGLAKALTSLWRNKNTRDKYINLGLRKVKQFSWQKTAKETLEVYKKVHENKI